MKRSGPIKRTKGLDRGKSQLKRSYIRKRSQKKAKQDRAFGPIRKAFKEMGCPCGRIATDTHEIHGAGVRCKTVELRELWIAACRKHHEFIQDKDKAWQYALKSFVDPEWYSLDKLNEYALRMVAKAEVEAEMPVVESWLREIRRK